MPFDFENKIGFYEEKDFVYCKADMTPCPQDCPQKLCGTDGKCMCAE